MNRVWLLALVLSTAVTISPEFARAADAKAKQSEPAADHPLGLIAFASIDRLLARAETLADAIGQPGTSEKLLTGVLGGDDGVFKFLNSPGLDKTRPIGVMCYPNWFPSGNIEPSTDEMNFDAEGLFDDPFSMLLGGSEFLFSEDATCVICIPCKDRDALLEAIRALIEKDGGQLKPAEDLPGWYRTGDDGDTRIGFEHHYLLIAIDDGEVKHFNRTYPDFGSLARSSLGKNGFVYSLYRKGLPPLVRDVMAPAFKMAFAARFQRQDDEPELQFQLRTMSSPLQLQLLDLAISHIDEIRLSGRVDSATKVIIVEPEIIGIKGGKLAKFFNDGKGITSQFASQPTDDAVFTADMSLPLPAKDWKPTADALYAFAQALGKSAISDVVRAFAKTVESGQFEVYTYNPSWNEGLIALRLSGGPQLPDQLQAALNLLSNPLPFELAIDAVDGVPIHRTVTSLDSHPTFAILSMPLRALLGQAPSFPDFNEPTGEIEVEAQVARQVKDADGTERVVIDKITQHRQSGKHGLWLAATPRAIWLGFGSNKSGECPDWFKTQIAASLAAPSSVRSKSPFQMTLRGLGTSSESEVQQVGNFQPADGSALPPGVELELAVPAGDAAAPVAQGEFTFQPVQIPPEVLEKQAEQLKARVALLKDLPNAIRCEFRPTDTGAKLTISFEDAYFHWFAAMMRDSIEANEVRSQLPPERIEPSPVP